jgi:hypothetical protein
VNIGCVAPRACPETRSGTRPTVNTEMNESQGSEAGRYMLLGPRPQDEKPPGRIERISAWLASGKVSDARVFWVAYAIMLPFFLAPLFATRLLPGLDLPFHIAAADMLSKVGNPSSPYAAYYEGGLRIAPYAAHFFALAILGKVMNLLAAHKLIIVLYVSGLPLAMAWLLGGCRRSRIPALLAFPLAYNLTLHYGFVSFALSLPVVLLVLAAMVRLALAHGGRRVFGWWIVAAMLAVLLFLCHLQNFLYGLCAALAFAVLVPASWRRKAVAVLALAPALCTLVWWHLQAPTVIGQARLTPALAWSFLKRHRLDDLGRHKLVVDLWNRILLIPAHAMRAFVDEINVPACKVVCLIMAVYILVGVVVGFRLRRVQDGNTFRRVPLALAGVISFLGALTAYLALPHHFQEMELMTFFPRFSVLVLLMLLLLVPGGLARSRGLLAVLLPLPAIVFGVVYGRQLYLHYRAYGAEVADFVAVAEKTPPGGKALGLVFERKSKVMQVESAMVGLPNFYPALRPAPGSMVPPAYCGLRHMPCRCKVQRDFVTNPWAPQGFSPAKMLPIFDYFFARNIPPGVDLFRGYHGMVEVLALNGSWAVFRKRPGPIVPDPLPPPLVPPGLPPPPAPVPTTRLGAHAVQAPVPPLAPQGARAPFDARLRGTPAAGGQLPSTQSSVKLAAPKQRP